MGHAHALWVWGVVRGGTACMHGRMGAGVNGCVGEWVHCASTTSNGLHGICFCCYRPASHHAARERLCNWACARALCGCARVSGPVAVRVGEGVCACIWAFGCACGCTCVRVCGYGCVRLYLGLWLCVWLRVRTCVSGPVAARVAARAYVCVWA